MANSTQAAPLAYALTGVTLADQALGGPAARSTYGVTGAGIKVGILSDSYNVNGTAAGAISQGLLPAGGVTVLKEGPAGSTNEGQAMAELIHQTAPGAQLYFYSADYSEQDFANGIQALAAAGCNVIVDDIAWEDEPFFQLAGPVDAATAQAIAQGVSYFSAAGNEGSAFFQGAFTPATLSVPGLGTTTAESFPGGSPYQTVTIPAGFSSTLSLQWEAPYIADNPPTLTVTAVGSSGRILSSFQVGMEPVALLNFPAANTSESYRIYVSQTPGTVAPAQFKFVLEGGGSVIGQGAGTGSGSIIGHDLVPGVNVIGAMNVAQTPAEGGKLAPESFTSTGPGQLLLDASGNVLAQPQTLNAPSFLAPDGASTSVFNPFLGTSASAAEAAAVAALMLQANPHLTHGEVSTLLADSAIPAGAASVAGAGLIQANLAVQYAESGVIAASPQPTVRGLAQAADTISGGGGSAQYLAAGGGATLIQSHGSVDTVTAGAGADTVQLLGASALLFGGGGSLLVTSMNGADTVIGGAAAVSVNGGTGGGQEFGSAAGRNRLVAGNAPTWLVQGGAADTLIGAGGGHDTLVATGSGAATLLGGGSAGNMFLATGSSSADLILPGLGGNQVWLGAGADTVIGGAGVMTVHGGSGASVVYGGTGGANVLLAGSGASTLVGGGAHDLLAGQGAGDLLMAASVGNDTLIGGSGREILAGGAQGVNILLAGAADALIAPQQAAAVVGLGSGDAIVQLGGGNTLLNLVNGQGGGQDFITGFDPARDLLRLAGYGGGAASALAAQQDIGGNTWLKLSDGTVLAFVGTSHLDAASVLAA